MHSRRGTVLVAVASVGVLLVLSQAATATRNLPRRSLIPTTTIAQAFSVAHPNDPVYVFSTTMLPTFPTVTLMGLKWGSRFPSLWPLAGLEAARALGRSDASELQNNYADELRQMVYEDFKQYRPIVVLVDVRQGQFGLPRGYQILEFFKHNVLFSRLWTRYREIGRRGEYLIYALKVEE